MARIKLGPVITDIAGSIGGFTIQRNRYGITMRKKPLPLNPATAAQLHIRTLMVTVQKAWQNLSTAERLQWNRYLDFSGQSILNDKSVKLSGHTLYLKYQLYRLLTGYQLLTTLTYVPMPAVPYVSELTIDAGVFELELSSAVDFSHYFFLFFITIPRHENKAFSRQGLRYMKVTPADSAIFEIQDSYISAFGVLPGVPHFVHYSIQWFSALAPVFTGISTGIYEVTA